MVRERVVETDSGIQGELNVRAYDEMQRFLRDRGWIETNAIIRSGIDTGKALEVGPGPGYLGLEWLKHTDGTSLVGLDISPDMIGLARSNAAAYGLSGRTDYILGRGEELPFDDDTFDAVFTNGSLHEWSTPTATFDQIWQVVKPGGRVFVSDLRRDMLPPMRWFLWLAVKPRQIRPGLKTSIDAAYTPAELETLVTKCAMSDCATVAKNALGVTITACKPA